jgi:hypothetical protein
MRLCMFHPVATPMERGWVGRVEGDEVVHLAAQTLQHVFTGGGRARDHARYPLAEVTLLAPLPLPPSIRVFDEDGRFEFANPAAVFGPGAAVLVPDPAIRLDAGLAGLVGLESVVAVSPVARLRAPALRPPKDRDFGIVLGPWFTTLDDVPPTQALDVTFHGTTTEARTADFDWEAARRFAESNTRLRVGDLLLAPATSTLDVLPGAATVDAGALGRLDLTVETS